MIIDRRGSGAIFASAQVSSLLDAFQDMSINPQFDRAGLPIVTQERWNLFLEFQTGNLNFYGETGSPQYVDYYGDSIPQHRYLPYWKNLTLKCIRRMWFVRDYMRGEFKFRGDKQFSQLWPIVVENWYFGKVWVIKSYDVMNLEIALAESDVYKDNVKEEKLLRGNPFRLFTNCRKEGNKYLFKSLLTGIDSFELDPKEMVYFSLDEGAKFFQWWEINMSFLAGQSRVIDSFKALSKTMSVVVQDEEQFSREIRQLENSSIVYQIFSKTGDGQEDNLYQSMPMTEGHRVREMRDINKSLYQDECATLGMVLNTNDKRERLTVAENYKDLTQIANLEETYLENLKMSVQLVKEKGWIGITDTVKISGATLGQGIPDAEKEDNFSKDKQFNNKPERPEPNKEF